MKIDNLVGKTFGKLKVIKIGDPYITPGGQKKTVWLCECSCGNPELIPVTATHLKSGHTTSCGCEKIRITKENNSRQNEYDLSGEYGIGYTRNTNVPFLFDLDDYDKLKNIVGEKIVLKMVILQLVIKIKRVLMLYYYIV